VPARKPQPSTQRRSVVSRPSSMPSRQGHQGRGNRTCPAGGRRSPTTRRLSATVTSTIVSQASSSNGEERPPAGRAAGQRRSSENYGRQVIGVGGGGPYRPRLQISLDLVPLKWCAARQCRTYSPSIRSRARSCGQCEVEVKSTPRGVRAGQRLSPQTTTVLSRLSSLDKGSLARF
jgi:hypothetical protein